MSFDGYVGVWDHRSGCAAAERATLPTCLYENVDRSSYG